MLIRMRKMRLTWCDVDLYDTVGNWLGGGKDVVPWLGGRLVGFGVYKGLWHGGGVSCTYIHTYIIASRLR